MEDTAEARPNAPEHDQAQALARAQEGGVEYREA